MLSKFSVTNFKGFDQEFTFDLSNTKNYGFNSDSIANGVVNNALVYGHNGVGKSNLGLAIFDIIGHLTDKNINDSDYKAHAYLNASNSSTTASFKYQFLFGDDVVLYKYEKTDLRTTVSESILINGKELARIDRRNSNISEIDFVGAETLNKELTNKNLSLLKYIRHNSVLERTSENEILFLFYHFVDSMLFFRSLNQNMYLGLETGTSGIQEDIIEKDNVTDLEEFLNKAGIECKLRVVKELDQDRLAFDFGGKAISFYDIASTGTRALVLFYYWRQRLREENRVSFLVIDEFDAFYHHDLSALIVEELKDMGIQFILTSHNTSIITNDLLRPDCYFLMNKIKIQSLSNCTPKELREAHNIEKMYKANSFNV
ncbi:MAG: ATP/GTP-binding protein [Flavobacteriales bacterium]